MGGWRHFRTARHRLILWTSSEATWRSTGIRRPFTSVALARRLRRLMLSCFRPTISRSATIMRTYFVYLLTNTPRGVLYVGVTRDLRRRVGLHKCGGYSSFTGKWGARVWSGTRRIMIFSLQSAAKNRSSDGAAPGSSRSWKKPIQTGAICSKIWSDDGTASRHLRCLPVRGAAWSVAKRCGAETGPPRSRITTTTLCDAAFFQRGATVPASGGPVSAAHHAEPRAALRTG